MLIIPMCRIRISLPVVQQEGGMEGKTRKGDGGSEEEEDRLMERVKEEKEW